MNRMHSASHPGGNKGIRRLKRVIWKIIMKPDKAVKCNIVMKILKRQC